MYYIQQQCTACKNSMHCKARQVLRNLFSINQRNGSEMTFAFVEGATNVNLKNLKLSYDWMTWCRQHSADINYIMVEDLNLWLILAKTLLKLKALKSAL